LVAASTLLAITQAASRRDRHRISAPLTAYFTAS
jgi:hypothetical protein